MYSQDVGLLGFLMTSHLSICKQGASASVIGRKFTTKIEPRTCNKPGVATSSWRERAVKITIGVPDRSSISERVSLPSSTWICNPELQNNVSPSDKAR